MRGRIHSIRWLIAFFVTMSSVAIGQNLIEGTVVDAQTGKPVPFASVGIEGTSKGTSTNLNGQFSLSVSEPVTLIVSCIGYETLIVTHVELGSIIKLNPGVTELNPIMITNKPLNARRIVRKAFSNIDNNYSTKPFLQKFFYRHYCKDGGSYGRLVEASVDVWKDVGYKTTSPSVGLRDQLRVTQLRRSLDKTKGAEGHEPISVADVLETDLIGYQVAERDVRPSVFSNVSSLKSDFKNYNFDYNGVTIYDGREVYEIDFSHKEDSVLTISGHYVKDPEVTGTLFIDTDNFAIVKVVQQKKSENSLIRSWVYYRKYNDKYYPYHFLVAGHNQNAALGTHEFHIELISVEIDNNPEHKFKGQLPNREELLRIPYDSTYWLTNTTLKTTPLENEIIEDLGGGKSLNKQFEIYREYELNTHNGGENAEQKFEWLKNYCRGKYNLYLVFWSEQFKSYIPDLEIAKRLHQKYYGTFKFVFISLDDDNERWKQTVERFNFFTDGIVNYRIGSKSPLISRYQVRHLPKFVLIDRSQEYVELDAKKPTDPALQQDFQRALNQNHREQ